MKIEVLESAKDDLRAGYQFYEKQARGVGEYFLDSIHADVRSLNIFAGVHEVIEGYHRMLAKRFPFAIYYRVTGDVIRIYAILDCRRDPEWINARLKSNPGD